MRARPLLDQDLTVLKKSVDAFQKKSYLDTPLDED
jgi:hypothetical protein